MRFAITADHREFFKKNNYIEFENILPADQVSSLKKNAEETISKRLKFSPSKLKAKTAPDIYYAGYDLWRENEEIKKITHKNAFATVASELFQTLPLRYGFDQYFSMFNCAAASPYDVPSTLQEISCLSPLAGGLILPLEDLPSPPTFFPMPLKSGSALFISSSFSLPWPHLFATCGLNFFMIVYATEKTMFRAGSHDPHAAALKKLGYVYNEMLKDSVHPILLRK